MADKNKVTIDAAWFEELWKKANEADKVCEDCVREKCGECAVVKERDVPKITISRMEKSVEQMREKDLRELDAVRKERDELKNERNMLSAKVNELKNENNLFTVDAGRAFVEIKERLELEERCIEDIDRDLERSLVLDGEYSPAAKSAQEIIRAYREKREVKR